MSDKGTRNLEAFLSDMFETCLANKQDPVRTTLNNMDAATNNRLHTVRPWFMGDPAARFSWEGLVAAMYHVFGEDLVDRGHIAMTKLIHDFEPQKADEDVAAYGVRVRGLVIEAGGRVGGEAACGLFLNGLRPECRRQCPNIALDESGRHWRDLDALIRTTMRAVEAAKMLKPRATGLTAAMQARPQEPSESHTPPPNDGRIAYVQDGDRKPRNDGGDGGNRGGYGGSKGNGGGYKGGGKGNYNKPKGGHSQRRHSPPRTPRPRSPSPDRYSGPPDRERGRDRSRDREGGRDRSHSRDGNRPFNKGGRQGKRH
jgi:hypothetical protein